MGKLCLSVPFWVPAHPESVSQTVSNSHFFPKGKKKQQKTPPDLETLTRGFDLLKVYLMDVDDLNI